MQWKEERKCGPKLYCEILKAFPEGPSLLKPGEEWRREPCCVTVKSLGQLCGTDQEEEDLHG